MEAEQEADRYRHQEKLTAQERYKRDRDQQVRAKQMSKQNHRSQLAQENSANLKQKANMLGLQFEAQDQDRQLKDFMYDQYMADIEQRKAKAKEVKNAQHSAENKRIAAAEAQYVKTDRAARLKKSKFLQELDEATEYQNYLKQAEKDKVKADHEGWLRYCQQLDD